MVEIEISRKLSGSPSTTKAYITNFLYYGAVQLNCKNGNIQAIRDFHRLQFSGYESPVYTYLSSPVCSPWKLLVLRRRENLQVIFSGSHNKSHRPSAYPRVECTYQVINLGSWKGMLLLFLMPQKGIQSPIGLEQRFESAILLSTFSSRFQFITHPESDERFELPFWK